MANDPDRYLVRVLGDNLVVGSLRLVLLLAALSAIGGMIAYMATPA